MGFRYISEVESTALGLGVGGSAGWVMKTRRIPFLMSAWAY